MSRKNLDPAFSDLLDRHYPFIEQGAEPPGRVGQGNDSRPWKSWVGKAGWRTRHGDAIVMWDRGNPRRVWNALLADGTKIEAQATMGAIAPWRYLANESPRSWIHGVVDIAVDGVTFTPGEEPDFAIPSASEHPDLEYDLARDSTLRQRLADDEDFADTLYGYLQNGSFWKDGGERIWSTGMRSAAALVANLRGFGDTYIDYFPHGGFQPMTDTARAERRRLKMPELSPELTALHDKRIVLFNEITEILALRGWRRATRGDFADAALATRRDLASWEQRPAATTPEWAVNRRLPVVTPPSAIAELKVRSEQMSEQERLRQEEIVSKSLQKRLHALATSGRVTEAEYRSMIRRIAQMP